MIQSVQNCPISQLFDIESNVVYAIPRYQREYTWGKWDWEQLFDDILENDEGYFLGSIICINPTTSIRKIFSVQKLELVDGQQRLTTLSLLFAAIYSRLNENDDPIIIEDKTVELSNLKRKLVLKKDSNQIRVIPQIHNNNLEDYTYILGKIGVTKQIDPLPYAGNRKMFKAYRYFQNRVDTLFEHPDGRSASIMEFLEKVNKTTLVMIDVANHSDAYTLFESLNNRGTPLTAIDLIKTKLLAKMEEIDPGQIDNHFEEWNTLLQYLGDEYAVQERFFRQYYNAFKPMLKDVHNIPVATRSNLMRIYEKLINNDAHGFLKDIIQAGKSYEFILGRRQNEQYVSLSKVLLDLERIQGTPSYLLLMYLLVQKQQLHLEEKHLHKVISFLVRFFVRRNLTDMPPTRDLTRLFMQVIEKIQGLTGDTVVETILQELLSVSPNDEVFRKHLEGPIYSENAGVVRFILCALEEKSMTRERQVDLWTKEGKTYVWTIEHIFPQGDNIPQAWVDMIADGDRDKAIAIKVQHVHRLGNLTISGYNSNLGNKSFKEKRERNDRQGRPVGYLNGLYLNEDLANATEWNVDSINSRTSKLIEETTNLFALMENK